MQNMFVFVSRNALGSSSLAVCSLYKQMYLCPVCLKVIVRLFLCHTLIKEALGGLHREALVCTGLAEALERGSNYSFPVAQMVVHGASNAKIMGSIPREKQELIKNVKL